MTLATLLSQVRQRWADVPAVVDGQFRLTYGELIDLGIDAVRGLSAVTQQPHPRIAVVMDNRWEYLAFDVGCGGSGATLVRCNARDSAMDLAHILTDSQSHVAVSTSEHRDLIAEAISQVPHAIHQVELPPAGDSSRMEALHEIAAASPRAPHGQPPTPTTTYRLMYTSGSTGLPKGVVVTHDQWRSAVLEHLFLDPLRDVGNDARMLHVTPLSHVAGGLFWAFMMTGALHIIAQSTDLDEVVQTCHSWGATHTFLVPTLIHRLVELDPSSAGMLESLRRVYYAASPIDPTRLRTAVEMFGSVFAQGYGSTEAMWWLTYLPPDDHAAALASGDTRRLSSCGRPSLGVPLMLVDDEGVPVGPEEVGEVVTQGRHVATSYYRRGPVPRISEGPCKGWFRTGDVGFTDVDGYVYLMDRKSDVIVTGGFNVYPREVELGLTRHPDISECCVVGAPDDEWGEAVVAVAVPREGANVQADDLIEFARRTLASYKRPRRIELRNTLPLTSNGKIDRKAVRAAFWQGRDRRI